MRYWIFQNNQVLGPYDHDELAQAPHFGPESLICPEGRKGTSIGDWQRAGLVPELNLSIVKASQLSVAGRTHETPRILAGLPPEPTLKDLAALGSLQEKVSFLENTVSVLQGELRMKDTELSNLHTQLEDKGVMAMELKKNLDALDSRVVEMGENLKSNIDKAVADEKDVASTVESQRRTIEGLTANIEKLQEELRQIEKPVGEIEKIKADIHQMEQPVSEIEKIKADIHQMEQPVSEIEKIKADIHQMEQPVSEIDKIKEELHQMEQPVSEIAKLKEELHQIEQPVGEIAKLKDELHQFEQKVNSAPAPVPKPGLAAPGMPQGAPFMAPPLGQPGASGGEFLAGAPDPQAPGAPLGAAPVVDAAPEPKKSKLKLFLFAGVGIAALGVGAFVTGVIPGMKKAAPPPPAPAPAPPPPPAPVEPPPEVREENAKKEALDLVKAWLLPTGKTVAQELEGGGAAALGLPGGAAAASLPQWMVEKAGEGLYQVNFYPAKGAGKGASPFEFEADIKAKAVKSRNKAAEAVLAGKPVEPPKKPRKGKKKSAGDALFGDEPASPAAAAGGSGNEDLFSAGGQEEAAADSSQAPAKKARKGRKKAAADGAADGGSIEGAPEVSIDDLLAPEMPAKKVQPLTEPSQASRAGSKKPKTAAGKGAAKEPAAEADDAKLLDDLLGQ
ncbi:MAG: hypothetical protein HY927_02600 [Elusimicrobia bacterium]|nr:hypothetical protein [Elusimicrobiota bacterium]